MGRLEPAQLGADHLGHRQVGQHLALAGMLELGEHADRPARRRAGARELDHLAQRQDAEVAVVGRVQRPEARHPLDGAQRAQLGEREVLGEPARARAFVDGLGGEPVGELAAPGDVGGPRQLALVPDDERAVPAEDDVGLDELGAQIDGEFEAGGGVLRAVGRCTAMADHDGLGKSGRGPNRQRLGRVHVCHHTVIG